MFTFYSSVVKWQFKSTLFQFYCKQLKIIALSARWVKKDWWHLKLDKCRRWEKQATRVWIINCCAIYLWSQIKCISQKFLISFWYGTNEFFYEHIKIETCLFFLLTTQNLNDIFINIVFWRIVTFYAFLTYK